MTAPLAPQIDLLWVLAHPDDESFGNAGTMLLAHDAGMTTGLVCATRGEAGEIRDPAIATRTSLAAVREQELRRAMRLAHVDTLRMLGFSDSGMAGTLQNENPRSLVQIPIDEVVSHVVGYIRELRPRAVIGFGPDGIYGHPDHIRIGEVLDQAVIEAAQDGQPGLGTPWRVDAHYHVTMPRERILLSTRNPESPFYGMSEEVLAQYGTPIDQITHWVDVRSKAAPKHEILMQHLTQISRDNPMVDPSSEVAKSMLSTEMYTRVPLPWDREAKEQEPDPLTRLRDAFPAPDNV
ncbi:MAG TPA: PIG-L family deacetylase [Thermomicrobiales bacterium]|nr:PIG-L family deacetylase [Thermomicrobiales bacterium]